ncbi:unnamed protein product [Sphagnum jensenii]|uniref:Uncharacterized protein n=1 Tax=Sphagnum jensenii TaxID=128206 RepID=A0ABP0W0Q5_9BRYO
MFDSSATNRRTLRCMTQNKLCRKSALKCASFSLIIALAMAKFFPVATPMLPNLLRPVDDDDHDVLQPLMIYGRSSRLILHQRINSCSYYDNLRVSPASRRLSVITKPRWSLS